MKKIIFIPSTEKGNGSGHLRRCCLWAESPLYDGYIYIPAERLKEYQSENNSGFASSHLSDNKKIVTVMGSNWDMALLDMRRTPLPIIDEWRKISSILAGVDEGGLWRRHFDYLIDTLPNPYNSGVKSNITSTGLLGIPDKRDSIFSDRKIGQYSSVLITFGGEDPAGITGRFLSDAVKYALFENREVTVVTGPFFKNTNEIKEKYSFFNIVESPDGIAPLIEKADIVFTSFGLTAYEALYAGKHVVLINPSGYHKKLSLIAGICEAGIINCEIRKVKKIVENPHLYDESTIKSLDPPSDITKLFKKASETEKTLCPVCKDEGKTVHRFPGKNYLKCRKCGIYYLQGIGAASKDKKYDKSYFFDEYKKQYGRTYLEDFDNISLKCIGRYKIIEKIKKQGKVLDIGCAYGPFLDVMNKKNYDCTGIDISEEAVGFVRDKPGIKAFICDFASVSVSAAAPVSAYSSSPIEKEVFSSSEKYDIITMWYVIEHFKETGEIIRKVHSLLAEGGLFAFSTPNFAGISGRKNMKKFMESSPDDHFTVFGIKTACRILSQYGYKVIKVRSTGHHPERFPLYMKKTSGLKILNIISRMFHLGDTFEIYAVKTGASDE
ncbi:MAG: methyltransferase domain-containing protein [Spirochaetia bacterium]|jgi:2-polyprenyl-3-methyl-5-hydroxy-6-metoxy-1,4-benzoquinol methylase|nr:methyltransferase domain-containing protein [Spirochaetia bacterium]